MPLQNFSPKSFQTFGDLLKYLRRRERLTQLELSIIVGYSEAQIGRLEKNQRRPDLSAIQALFIPTFHLDREPALSARLLELAESARQDDAPAPGVAPYKGLLFFDEADADLFFGRETLTAHLAERVNGLAMDASTRLMAVVGASGSGKSSLLRAGLVVVLKQAGWDVRTFTPGANPLEALERHLGSDRMNSQTDRTLILVDQFEEVFTLCRNETQRLAFIQRLFALARDASQKTTVVIALRADFYSHCSQYPLLRNTVAAEQEYIGQMTAEELRRAIEEPAKRGGWRFEPGLVDILLQDIGAQGTSGPEPGALPLLSHALLATWEHRRGRTFTLDGYRASGGVRGAIAETAESVFTDQLNREQQELARNVFLRLTELGEGTEDTRRRAALNELVRNSSEAEQLRAVLNTLAEARLITLNEDSAEVAHEALIREWQRLHEWLTQDRDGLRLHRHLTESAHEWEARRHDPSELYRGARLAQAREWAENNREKLNKLEGAFLAASIEREEREVLERERQRQHELEAARRLAESLKWVENEKQLAISRELAIAAISNIDVDPERSILLALHALSAARTAESESALHSAVQALRLQFTLDHALEVSGVAYSPDGTRLATNSNDMVQVWNAATGEKISSFLIPFNSGRIKFSPDGTRLATDIYDKETEDYSVLLLDAASGGEMLKFSGHTNWIQGFAWSRDGRMLATGSLDTTARVWDAETGQELLTLSGHTNIVETLSFDPDGTRLVTGSWDSTVKVWDLMSGEEIYSLTEHTAGTSALFSPDGTRIVTWSTDVPAIVWDASIGQKLLTLQGPSDYGQGAITSDGRYFIKAQQDGKTTIWDLSNGEVLLTIPAHSTTIWDLAVHPTGTHLATISRDGTAVKVWDISPQGSREWLTLTGLTGLFPRAVYSPDGTRLATPGPNNSAVIWEAEKGEQLMILSGHSDIVMDLAFSPDGMRLATSSRDMTAIVWDAFSGKKLHILSRQGHGDGLIGATNSGITDVAFNSDGRFLATAGTDGTAIIWDLAAGQALLTVSNPRGFYRVAFSPDDKYLATSGGNVESDGNSNYRIWDVRTGEELFRLPIPILSGGLAFSPDGTRIVTSGFGGVVKMWETRTGRELISLSGHTGGVPGAAFSPDGSTVATASRDGSAKIWSATTGVELITLLGHDGGVSDIAFSPDGTRLVTASDDGTARVYLLNVEELIALAWKRVTRSLTPEECQTYLHMATCPDISD